MHGTTLLAQIAETIVSGWCLTNQPGTALAAEMLGSWRRMEKIGKAGRHGFDLVSQARRGFIVQPAAPTSQQKTATGQTGSGSMNTFRADQ